MSRLVITPLTECCCLILTSVLQFFCGGFICIVINCSDTVTVICWPCEIQCMGVLRLIISVITEQLYTVQAATDAGLSRSVFWDNTILTNQRNDLFITMNIDHVGLAELPDILKLLFMQILMMVTESFNNGNPLAQNGTQLDNISSEIPQCSSLLFLYACS